ATRSAKEGLPRCARNDALRCHCEERSDEAISHRFSPSEGRATMKALVTGFEPFGGDPDNPAFEAMGRLPPRLGPLTLATRVLPAVFGQALDALEDAIAASDPDIVLCIGLAGGRAALSLERV